MKNLVLRSVLVAVFALFSFGSMNAQEEIKAKVEVTTGEVSKEAGKSGCDKTCCAHKGEGKKECAQGEDKSACSSKKDGKKSCGKKGKKSCSKKDGDKKACKKKDKKSCNKKDGDKKAGESGCEKACCTDKK